VRRRRACHAIARCGSHVARATSEAELLARVCHTLVELGGYRTARAVTEPATGGVTALALPIAPFGTLVIEEPDGFTDEEREVLAGFADDLVAGLAAVRARQAQKLEAVGRLAGGVAHEFNNLLSVVLTYATLVLDELAADDAMRAEVEELRRAGERATELTQQLLAFSGRQLVQPLVLDLRHLVGAMEPRLRRLLRDDIELVLAHADSPARVEIDRAQIEQVIANLAVNARDAMPAGGSLRLATTCVELEGRPHVMLEVTDTGVGMDAVVRERIFEPFFTTKETGTGIGLGLSTAFGIVTQSRGRLAVDSEPGCGATFRIFLPRTDRPADDVPVPPPETIHGSETILLVEDDEQVRTMTRAILQRHGYNVLDAPNGGEAFLVCEKYAARIHVLLTDVVMPRMSGRELAERLATMRPDLRVLYISGYDVELERGAAFLRKPITPDALLRKLREVLA